LLSTEPVHGDAIPSNPHLRYPYSESALACANGDSTTLDLLVEQLCGFYHASRFASFWEEQAGAYRSIKKQIASSADTGWAGEDVVATMESYFGQERTAYVLVPTPMERPGGGTMDAMGKENNYILACFDGTVDREETRSAGHRD
jgi:hypothetical protein